MRLKPYGKFLMLTAMALGAPIGCGDDSSGASGGGGAGSSGSGSKSGTTGSSSGTTGSSSGSSSSSGGSLVHPEWPEAQSVIPQDKAIEDAITALIAKMSVEQKVGQIIQTEIASVTPAEVKQYHLGSVLNGGGGWPDGNNKYATPQAWLAAADAYYAASTDTSGGDLGIPIIWGTDAVHGQNKLGMATIFPHNIGVGAANDPALVEKLGAITAEEVSVIGLDWTFAPVLAAVQDDRWGRTYESYSEDPALVKSLADHIVKGFQGDAAKSTELLNDSHLIATAKHFLGDGGTFHGIDQGDTKVTEEQLRDIHAPGYIPAINAGVQTVMASYNSWNGVKMHGNKYLLTDILKGKFHFDGFVIGDWSAHDQIPGCTPTHCPAAINDGLDMFMAPYNGTDNSWKDLYKNTIKDVNDGSIPKERLDDAVRRILRVKMRFGLLGPKPTKGKPSSRGNAGKVGLLGSPEHRDVAREVVRKSQVLLKNKGGVLPLAKTANVLVAGKSANNIGNQCGGWTLDWQGASNINADFPGATSIFAGIQQTLGAGGAATLSPDGTAASPATDVAIVVIGETPYAEFKGDIRFTPYRTMEHNLIHPEDLLIIQTIKAQAPAAKIVTVFLSGRPLYVNKELNASDAFVASWLPGSEGKGVAEVLFGDFPFSGKLSFSWPASGCQVPINKGDGQTPLFAVGFGLKTTDADTLPKLPEDSAGPCTPTEDKEGPGPLAPPREDPPTSLTQTTSNASLLQRFLGR